MTDLTDTDVTRLRRAAMDAAAAGRVRVLGGHWLPKDQLDSALFFDDNDGLGDAVNLLLQDWAIRLVDPNDPSDFTERLHSGNLTGDEKRTFYTEVPNRAKSRLHLYRRNHQ
ncbi:hypothetical protein AB0H00_12965 [Nocardia sp. NPDC023852]|uniref:hypothetical protein n=1 Tax=Nocardia sp. NPDC023852 TaxID=3154697 RepID=UPI00340B1A7A